ncbi:ribosome-binding factor A [Chitinophaga jiangningensis]|uniref:Ribosome-binding factor A n=1 Tax=Chitinophaga jiangningensis TaxID=1419482 RepID=A0A1M7DTA9_9BACT|nr:30S ribosome-binding factor RbfA [Chitinophaga jiangningensis]SHL82696.1 ribosome-binding factor A [Chitinophaga jiangningensis]
MQETKRQKQIGQLIQEELSDIFQRMGFNVLEGGMISIAAVKMTPDLLEAKVYLSMFQIKDQDGMLGRINERMGEIKKALGQRVGKQLRRVPELTFFLDETLDYVFKMEELFKKIKEDDSNIKGNSDINKDTK